MEYSITRALSKLKLLDKQIDKELSSSSFVESRINNGKIKDKMTDEEFSKKAKSSLASVQDLIKLRATIKSKIVESNAANIVEVAGIKMSVADAIERKLSIKYDKKLLKTLLEQYIRKTEDLENRNEYKDSRLQDILEKSLGKDRDNKKDEIETITESFNKTNKWILVDAIGIENVIDSLQAEIDEFEYNVDFVLSEANTLNKIEI